MHNDVVEEFEKDASQSSHSAARQGEAIPAIQSALQNGEQLQILEREVRQLNASDRQLFLAALDGAEKYLRLEDEKLDFSRLMNEVAPISVGAVIGYVITSLILPHVAAAGAVAAGSTLAATSAVKARLLKRDMIRSLRTLRRAASGADEPA